MFRFCLSVLIFLYFVFITVSSFASEQEQAAYKEIPPQEPSLFDMHFMNRLEFNSGVDVRGDSFFGYGGFMASLSGERGQPGWLVKWNTGTGEYNYHTGREGASIIYSGKVIMHDLMLGYYFRENDFIAKVYLGANYTEHRISPFDVGNQVQGVVVGAKAQAELWYRFANKGWSSLDLSYSSAFDDYLALGRVGYDLSSSLSFGLEGSVAGNMNYNSSRLGGVMRIKMDIGEITLNAGMGGDVYTPNEWEPYGGLSFFQKF